MSYLTDDPWPLIIIFSGLAIASAVIRHPRFRQASAVLVLAAVGVYALSELIVSSTEIIRLTTEEMLQEFKDENLDGIAAMISEESPKLIDTARRGLDLVAIDDDFHIRHIEVELISDTKAQVRIRANGNVTHRSRMMNQRISELWDTTWTRQEDQWKLTKATRLNPISAKPMGTFDSY